MADGTMVVLLLAFIWAAILVPPAAGARAAREAEFLGSIRPDAHLLEGGADGTSDGDNHDPARFPHAPTANARRRQVLGGLVVAIGATLVLGLLPTFRLLLVVHLLLVNSCLAYVGLLVHLRDERAASAGRLRRTDRRRAVVPVASFYADYAHDPEADYDDEFTAAKAGYDTGSRLAHADSYDGYDGYDDDEAAAEAAHVDEFGLALPA